MAYRTLYYGVAGEIREYEPMKRTIFFYYDKMPFFLQFPYLVFYYRGTLLSVAFSDCPIESFNQIIFHATLTNIYEQGRVCGCDGRNMDECISKFWEKPFNGDGVQQLQYLQESFYTGLSWLRAIFFIGKDLPVHRSALFTWAKISKKKRAKDLVFERIRRNPCGRFGQFFDLGRWGSETAMIDYDARVL